MWFDFEIAGGSLMIMLFILLFRWHLVATGDVMQPDVEMEVTGDVMQLEVEMTVSRMW